MRRPRRRRRRVLRPLRRPPRRMTGGVSISAAASSSETGGASACAAASSSATVGASTAAVVSSSGAAGASASATPGVSSSGGASASATSGRSSSEEASGATSSSVSRVSRTNSWSVGSRVTSYQMNRAAKISSTITSPHEIALRKLIQPDFRLRGESEAGARSVNRDGGRLLGWERSLRPPASWSDSKRSLSSSIIAPPSCSASTRVTARR